MNKVGSGPTKHSRMRKAPSPPPSLSPFGGAGSEDCGVRVRAGGLQGRGCPHLKLLCCTSPRAAALSLPGLGTDRGLTCPPASALTIWTAHCGPPAGVSSTALRSRPNRQAGLGQGRCIPAWGASEQGTRSGSRVSRQVRPCPGRGKLRSGPAAGFGVSRAETGRQALGLEARAGGEGREAAAGPRELQTTGLAPSPCRPQTRGRGAPGPLRLLVSTPSSRTELPASAAGASRGQPRPETVRVGLRREGGAGGEARLPGSPACHICTYLKLCWWSALFGMPIAGLASYDICID